MLIQNTSAVFSIHILGLINLWMHSVLRNDLDKDNNVQYLDYRFKDTYTKKKMFAGLMVSACVFQDKCFNTLYATLLPCDLYVSNHIWKMFAGIFRNVSLTHL